MPDLARDILTLVSIPSETGNESLLCDYLEERLRPVESRDLRLVRRGDSLILGPRRLRDAAGAPAGAPGRPFVLLAGHIDTVARGDAPEPALKGDRVHGRGSADMKSGLAVMLALAEELPPEVGFADRVFIFYAGEEGSAEGNALGPILREEAWLREAALGILLEPTDGQLELGCNGSVHVEVAFPGTACHSARPWRGRHPLRDALAWLERMLHFPIREAEIGGVVFREVVTLTTLRAGEGRNVVPGRLIVNLNLRYAPDRTPEEAERMALELCSVAEAKVVDHAAAGRVVADAPLYRYLCRSTGLPRRAKQGWTDVARLTGLGIPALNWGPGDPELAHTGGESVSVGQAQDCLARLAEFFESKGP